MKKITILWLLLGLTVTVSTYAVIPENYYAAADGKKGDALLDALHSIIDDHDIISYSGLEPYYAQTDLDSTGKIWDMYSLCDFTTSDANCSQKHVCDCWNKEHSVPQSYFNEASPMKSDLFHVYPTDARVNNFRSNYPYGETSSTSYIDSDKKSLGRIGSSSFDGYSGTVYEPADEYKGDFARTYFYMVARYLDKNFTQATNGKATFTYSNGRAGLTTYGVNLMLKWHRQDPVSKKEIDRNNAVYGIQHNRNPFIDYPYLAEYIWGKKTGNQVSFATDLLSSESDLFVPGSSDGSLSSITPVLTTSTSQIILPTILQGETASHTFTFTNANFTADIQVSVSGKNADLFSVTPSLISSAKANKSTELTISFTPVEVGSFSAMITISSEGVSPLKIPVLGSCASQCSVTWKNNGVVYSDGDPTTVVAMGAQVAVLPTAPKSQDSLSTQFVGWSAYQITDSTNEVPVDLFSDVSEAPYTTSDVTYYAVFARMDLVEGSDTLTSSVVYSKLYSTNTEVKSTQIGSSVVKFVQASASTQAKYYTSGNSVRCYAKSRIDVLGKNISRVVITFGSGGDVNAITASPNTYSDGVWTGKADSIAFSIGGTSGHRRIAAISVTAQEKAQTYEYSRYITSTGPMFTTLVSPIQQPASKGRKFIQSGELWIEYEGTQYNVLGIKKTIIEQKP